MRRPQAPPRGFWLCVAGLVALLAWAPAASAEQHVWSFSFESGQLQAPTEIYASQNFPSDAVPKGTTFNVFMQLLSNNEAHDVTGDGLDAVGCTIMEETAAPGTDEANWRNSRLTVRMDGDACSITRWMLVQNDAQTSVIYNHTFTFTVEAYSMVEFGQHPTEGAFAFWFVALFWFALVVASLMRGWLLVGSWSVMQGLGVFYESWPISLTAGLVGLLLFLVVQAIADGALGRALAARVKRLFGGDEN